MSQISLADAVAQVASDLAALPSVTGATVDDLAALQTDVATALTIAQQAQAYFDAQMAVVGDPSMFASGTPPAIMVRNVTGLQLCAQQLSAASSLVSSLGRLAKNIAAIQN